MWLQEIRLQTSFLPELYHFYKEVLELEATCLDEKNISITAGKSTLIFEEIDKGINPFYHFAFNIPSNKFDQAFEWIKDRVELLWLDDYKSYVADFANWHAKSFYFIDPAGNILELIARFDLNDNISEKFSSMHIRNVSEIGLVFPPNSFQADVNNLLQQYSLPYFDKQSPLQQFMAVGNDEGLFIIVPENRIWFSTKDSESKIFPMEIIFEESDISYKLKM
ncbi:MAG: hypothetical protein ABI091_02575 [Ferruginibacter sp.]